MNEAQKVQVVPKSTTPLPNVLEANGLIAWISSVDHKQIGIMYLFATAFFFLAGGIEAMMIRIQLMRPENSFISPETYNQIFTMHGTTMIFLVVVPMLIGLSIYFVPLMIGTRDMAFPRLNAMSFWVFVFGGLMLYYSSGLLRLRSIS